MMPSLDDYVTVLEAATRRDGPWLVVTSTADGIHALRWNPTRSLFEWGRITGASAVFHDLEEAQIAAYSYSGKESRCNVASALIARLLMSHADAKG